MWVLCSTMNEIIFDPVICDSKEEALTKMDNSIENVINTIKASDVNDDYHCYSISNNGMSYQIFTKKDTWSWKIFNFVMKVDK